MSKKKINIKKIRQLVFNLRVADDELVTIVKLNLNIQNQIEIFKLADSQAFRKTDRIICSNLYPQNYAELTKFPLNTSKHESSSGQFEYMINSLIRNQDELKEFARLRLSLESSLSRARYEESYKICDEIEKKFGASFWLLEKYVRVSRESDVASIKIAGIQKEISNSGDLLTNSFYAVLKRTINGNLNVPSLLLDLNSSLDLLRSKHSASDTQLAYSFLLTSFFMKRNINMRNYLDSMFLSEATSLVDRYIVCEKYFDTINSDTNNLLEFMERETVDLYQLLIPPYQKKMCKSGNGKKIDNSLRLNSVVDAAVLALENNNNFLDYYQTEVIVLCWNDIPDETKKKLIVFDFFRKYDEVNGDLYAEYQFFVSECFKNLNSKYLYPLSLLSERFIFNDNYEFLFADAVKYSKSPPDEYFVLSGQKSSMQEHVTTNEGPSSNWDKLYIFECEFKQHGHYKDIEKVNPRDSVNYSLLFEEKIASVYFWALVKNKEYLSACEFLVLIHDHSEFRFDYYPVKELLDQVYDGGVDITHKNYAPCLLYYFFSKSQSIPFNKYKMFTFWDNFMRTNNLKSPVDILGLQGLSNDIKKHQKLFLNDISVFDVIKRFLDYKTTVEVCEVRIRVLQELMLINDDNGQVYLDEIEELTKSEVSITLKREIERGKIYFDRNGLVKELKVYIVNNYNAFLAIRNGEYSASIDASFAFYNQFGGTNPVKKSGLITNGSISDFFVFKMIINHVRRGFLHSEICGVNNFIGTRIRHNIFRSEINSVLMKNGILTSSTSCRHVGNATLEGMTNGLDGKRAIKKFRSDLSSIYKRLESTIDNFTENYLKVRGQNNPYGAFLIEYSDTQIRQIMDEVVSANCSDAEFLNLAIDRLISDFSIELNSVREYYLTSLLPKINSLIDEIFYLITRNGKKLEIDVFKNNFHRDFKAKSHPIAEWFYFEGQGTGENFRFADVLFYSLSYTRNTNPGKNIVLTEIIEPEIQVLEIMGRHVKTLAFCLKILLDNIIKYALGEGGEINGIVKCERVANGFSFVFENKAELTVDNIKNLRRIEAEISKQNFKIEGGSSGLKRVYSDLISKFNFNKDDISFEYKRNVFKFECVIQEGKVYGYSRH